jgi:hypothetical protein
MPFVQGMSGVPRKDQLVSGNLPGNVHHAFDGPEFPPHFLPGDSFPSTYYVLLFGYSRAHDHGLSHLFEPSSHHFAGHMHPGDPNQFADYSRHGFPKEPVHFGLVGHQFENINLFLCLFTMQYHFPRAIIIADHALCGC